MIFAIVGFCCSDSSATSETSVSNRFETLSQNVHYPPDSSTLYGMAGMTLYSMFAKFAVGMLAESSKVSIENATVFR